ncbi:DUF1345 domain-containing protein [Pseudactinotalea terrae]|uniref:DUF1345 domain-containing protein n=1 Tax=Pseudactinotalea terrae TaxID=1743262 RepID=UPI001391684B|nr:DUF1345 domain-containing protein [Pseudactinotalea terrae]
MSRAVARIRTLLTRETVRHALGSAVAVLIAFATTSVGVRLNLLDAGATSTPLLVTLMFGLYGPTFLVLSWWTFRTRQGEHLRTSLMRSQEHRGLMRWLFVSSPTTWAGTVMLIGVISVVMLATGQGRPGVAVVVICVVGVIGSWVLMLAVMSLEYMRNWASENSMSFPGSEPRSFVDFLYLSIQLSTTFSSADVALEKRSVRKLASLHSVLAFAYSTAIIAVFASLLISISLQS